MIRDLPEIKPSRAWRLPAPDTARPPEDGRYVPEEVYWETYYNFSDVSYEWNNGFLEAKPLTDYAKYRMYAWLIDILKDFLHVFPVARMIGLEMGFRLVLPSKVTIRKPDLGVVLNTNQVPLGDKDRTYEGIFDLCIESLSDSSQVEIDRDTIVKKAEYAFAGVREYYILDDQEVETAFYQLTAQGIYEPIDADQEGVIRSRVLPGFQFRVDDLYRQPLPPDMIGDPVYSSYVSPYFRAERERAEQAELALTQIQEELSRKDQALTRKDAEIENLKARLHQAGIAID